MSVKHIATLSIFVSFVTIGFGGVVKMRDCPPGDKLTPPNGNKIFVDYAFADMCINDTCTCMAGEAYVLEANMTINSNAKNLRLGIHFQNSGTKLQVIPDQNVCPYITVGPCENIVPGTKVMFKHNMKVWDQTVPFSGIATIIIKDDTDAIILCGTVNAVYKMKEISGLPSGVPYFSG